MFNINFLLDRSFEAKYLKKNHPKVWEDIKYEVKFNIYLYVFCFFIAVIFLSLINITPESQISNSAKWVLNTFISIIVFIGTYYIYQEIVHWNNKYLAIPYISNQIVAEIRMIVSVFEERESLNKIISVNTIKGNSKMITKSRL